MRHERERRGREEGGARWNGPYARVYDRAGGTNVSGGVREPGGGGGYDEAGRVFEKMLWLNPSDNQGVRFLIEDVRAGKAWEENRDQR